MTAGVAVVNSVPADVRIVLGFFSSPALLSVVDTETHIMRIVYKIYDIVTDGTRKNVAAISCRNPK